MAKLEGDEGVRHVQLSRGKALLREGPVYLWLADAEDSQKSFWLERCEGDSEQEEVN